MADEQYYLNDPRWADVKIGNHPNLTINMVGCLLTSLTMVMILRPLIHKLAGDWSAPLAGTALALISSLPAPAPT